MYSRLATSKNPALVVILVDASESIGAVVDEVRQAVDTLLRALVAASIRGSQVQPRYRIALLSYHEHVEDVLGGVWTIDELAEALGGDGIPPFVP